MLIVCVMVLSNELPEVRTEAWLMFKNPFIEYIILGRGKIKLALNYSCA